ncbi:TolC family protein [Spirochaeta dissipatitropha]
MFFEIDFRLALACVFFAVLSLPVFSESPDTFLSLDQALSIGREASPDAVALRTALREAELSYMELRFPYTTALNLQAGVAMDFSSDPLEPQFSDSLRLSAGVLPGLDISAGYSRAAGADAGISWQPVGAFDNLRRQQVQLDFAQLEAAHAVLAFDLRVMRVYASAAQSRVELDFSLAERDLAQSEYEVRRRRAEAGLISMNDLEQARRQLVSAETALIAARRQHIERYAELSGLLGHSVQGYDLELPLAPVGTEDLQYGSYSPSMPDGHISARELEDARLENRILESELSLQKSERFWLPSLSLGLDARQQNDWIPALRIDLQLGIAARDFIAIERARNNHRSLLQSQRMQADQDAMRAELDELSFALSRASYEAAVLDYSLTSSDHELAERSHARGMITDTELERSRLNLSRSQYRKKTAHWQLYLEWFELVLSSSKMAP